MLRLLGQNGIINISGLKMMVKSGLETIIVKFLQAQYYFSLPHKREEVCPKLPIQ